MASLLGWPLSLQTCPTLCLKPVGQISELNYVRHRLCKTLSGGTPRSIAVIQMSYYATAQATPHQSHIQTFQIC